METLFPVAFLPNTSCSYPTYEEWKQSNNEFGISIVVNSSSYPTYEEWKLNTNPLYVNLVFTRSYPTYEEWKLSHLN